MWLALNKRICEKRSKKEKCTSFFFGVLVGVTQACDVRASSVSFSNSQTSLGDIKYTQISCLRYRAMSAVRLSYCWKCTSIQVFDGCIIAKPFRNVLCYTYFDTKFLFLKK